MRLALVGMALRFPGDLSNEEGFWEALKAQKDLISQIDSRRWPVDELHHTDPNEPGRSLTFRAGVLSDVDRFDAAFFGISPREAALMDPQQRLLLELTWEALEDAGIRPACLRGSNTGVFVGISGVDYGMRSLDDLSVMGTHSMTGNTLSIAANRLSYVFDLHGPSLAVDTACSSSLVALHQACNSLRLGESSLAIVGGINLLLHPYPFVGFSKASMLSPQGQCRAFDAGGQGYVRSEGGAVLVLKRLEDAEADGDRIHAVILGTGVNADGARKTGLTIPSVEGQVELMSRVLAEAGLEASDIDYLEAHGTGTPVGDPVEAKAIGRVYGRQRADGPLPIGSVKTNLGHLEPASGMAGLIKSVLVLKHREIPPVLHLEQRNPNIDFEALNLEPVDMPRRLSGKASPVAGVNSFGFGGANAHVLLRAHDAPRTSPPVRSEAMPPLLLSARSDASLRALASCYAERVRQVPERYYDIAHGACFRRERLDKRLLVRADDPAGIVSILDQVAGGESAAGAVFEEALPERGRLAFVYAGNGAQWHGMARTLLNESPVFAEEMERLDAMIAECAGFSVLEEIHSEPDASRLADTEVAQPALFAIQVALTELLRAEGIVPEAVCGHSVGEVAAGWAAGLLDLEQAVEVICKRSAAQGLARGSGRMAAVAMSADALATLIAERFPGLEIAGVNSSGNCTVSGAEVDILALADHLDSKGTFCRVLDLDYAFHSSAMDPIRESLQASLDGFTPQTGARIDFFSTVSGARFEGPLDTDYWWRNVRRPVQFANAVQGLLDSGCRILVEISPHPILKRYLCETLESEGKRGRVLSTLRRGDDGLQVILDTVNRILALDEQRLEACFPVTGAWIDLPRYAWDKTAYWLPRTQEALGLFDRYREHPLLGWRMPGPDLAWENSIDPVSCPWLGDHVVDGAVVLPGAAFAEMALAAAACWLDGEQGIDLEELDIVSPMVFEDGQSRQTRFEIHARDRGFRILSRPRLANEDWQLHALGRLPGKLPSGLPTLPDWPVSGDAIERDAECHYALTDRVVLQYGPAFRGLRHSRRWPIEGVLEGEIAPPPAIRDEMGQYCLHPAVLDVCFQALIDFFEEQIAADEGVPFVPTRIGRLRLWRQGAGVAHFVLKVHHIGLRSIRAEILLRDSNGQLVGWLEDCRFRAVPVHRADRGLPACWHNRLHLRPLEADQPTSEVPTPGELASLAARCLAGGDGPIDCRTVREYLPLLEGLTLALIGEAFRRFSADRPDAFRRSCEVLDETEGTGSTLFAWAANRLQEEKLLRKEGDDWTLDERNLPPAASVWEVLLREYPASMPELALLGLIGDRLAELFEGRLAHETLARAVLDSPHGELLYDTSPLHAEVLDTLERLVRRAGEALPATRRLRVLEIGCGSPRLAQAVMRNATFSLDYVVVSLGEQENVSGDLPEDCWRGRWNDEADAPVLPPEAPAAFDLLVLRDAAVFLSGRDRALCHLRDCLAEGGVLVMADRFADDAVQLLDHVLAPEQAGVAAREPGYWRDVLPHAGFRAVESVQHDDELYLGAWLLLARALEQEEARPEPRVEAATWWLMASDPLQDDFADALASELAGHNQQVRRLAGAAPEDEVALPDGAGHLVWLAGEAADAPDEASAVALLRLARALAMQERQGLRLWIVTRGGEAVAGSERVRDGMTPRAGHGVLWGLGRVIMNEQPELSATLIDLDPTLDSPRAMKLLVRELLYGDGANEVLLSAAGRRIVQMAPVEPPIPAEAQRPKRFRLDFYVPGQLRNLVWLAQAPADPGPHEVEVEVVATGLNFRDVMYAMGMLPDEAVEKGFAGASLGLEFAGRVTRVGASVSRFREGDAVMGFGSACFGSHVVTREDALAPKPAAWEFEQAATVPTVFFTVYYALQHLARLQPGERVLIHGAAGGVGIAAIQLARHLGAEIHATAGSDEKRAFVRLLGADHVYDSRSLDFADQILDNTGGEGVDVVLNSLAGEAIRRNLRVLRPFGRFLELGKRDFFENTPIGLRPFKDNISYFGIDADQLLVSRPELAGRLFRELMALFEDGVLYPLPSQVFEATHIVDAFRAMQQARHIGKIVVRMAGQELPVEPPRGEMPQARLRSDAAYLVTGGLSGFGLASARWLARRGAGELILVGRRGMQTPGAEAAVASIESLGARVTVKACDVSDGEAVARLVDEVRHECLPLAGVLHAAMVIDDGFITQLDLERLHKVLAAKAQGAWYLHKATRELPLDHFILYSSITTYIGNPGQANYVAANAYLESLAALRRAQGLPAVCVGWGPIGDAGYLTRNESVRDSLEAHLGAPPLPAERALSVLDRLLESDTTVLGVADMSWPTLARYLGAGNMTRFALMARLCGEAVSEDEADFRQRIAGKSGDEVSDLVREVIVREIAEILGLAEDKVDPARPLREMGLDSLMGAELVVALEAQVGIRLPMMLLSQSPSVDQIVEHLVARLLGDGEVSDGMSEDELDDIIDTLADQHAVDVATPGMAGVADEIKQALRLAQDKEAVR